MKSKHMDVGIWGGLSLLFLGVLASMRTFEIARQLDMRSEWYDDPIRILADQTKWNAILTLVFVAFVAVPILHYVVARYLKRDMRKSWFVVLGLLGLIGFMILFALSFSVDPDRLNPIVYPILYGVFALFYQSVGCHVLGKQDDAEGASQSA